MNQLVSDIKRALEEIKRLKGRVDNLKVVTTGSSSGTVSGVLLSDADPLPVGAVADPGVGTEASRYDHVHVGGTSSGKYRQFTYTGDNPFEFIVDGDGQPVFALLDLE
jgi:hypothetical protein